MYFYFFFLKNFRVQKIHIYMKTILYQIQIKYVQNIFILGLK